MNSYIKNSGTHQLPTSFSLNVRDGTPTHHCGNGYGNHPAPGTNYKRTGKGGKERKREKKKNTKLKMENLKHIKRKTVEQ